MRSAEERVRSWRGAPKSKWGASAKRRREGKELARNAEKKVKLARNAKENMRRFPAKRCSF